MPHVPAPVLRNLELQSLTGTCHTFRAPLVIPSVVAEDQAEKLLIL